MGPSRIHRRTSPSRHRNTSRVSLGRFTPASVAPGAQAAGGAAAGDSAARHPPYPRHPAARESGEVVSERPRHQRHDDPHQHCLGRERARPGSLPSRDPGAMRCSRGDTVLPHTPPGTGAACATARRHLGSPRSSPAQTRTFPVATRPSRITGGRRPLRSAERTIGTPGVGVLPRAKSFDRRTRSQHVRVGQTWCPRGCLSSGHRAQLSRDIVHLSPGVDDGDAGTGRHRGTGRGPQQDRGGPGLRRLPPLDDHPRPAVPGRGRRRTATPLPPAAA